MAADERPNKPVVTGLSPKEGAPGTQVTIRGENLGLSQQDLIAVFICCTDCTVSARWVSSHKVVARVGNAPSGAGDVLVITRKGGRGACDVQFRVIRVAVGPTQESAVWVDETLTVPGRQAISAEQSTSDLHEDDPLRINKGTKMKPANDPSVSAVYGSSSLKQSNFSPAALLLEKYSNASLGELQRGLANLRSDSSNWSQSGAAAVDFNAGAPKNKQHEHVRAQLHSYMSCLDALDNCRANLAKAPKWPPTEHLEGAVVSARDGAESLFAQVLTRKERADRARSALGLIARFKFLFLLPHNIDVNLEKHDYGAILSEYARAKSLYGDTDVELFKEVFGEVEKRMTVFKRTLHDKLLEVPSTLETQKKLIKFILILEPQSDPGADCLNAYHFWLESQFWNAQQRCATKALDQKREDSSDSERDDSKMCSETPQRFEFVDLTLSILGSKLQSLYKLAQAYVDGSLSAKPNLHREEEIEDLLVQTVNLASWLMMHAAVPGSVPNAVSDEYAGKFVKWPRSELTGQSEIAHLSQVLRKIRSTISTLLGQEFKARHVQPLMEFCNAVRIRLVLLITNQYTNDMLEIWSKETWKSAPNAQMQVSGSRTQLPDLFEAQVCECAGSLRLALSFGNFANEKSLFVDERIGSLLHERVYNVVAAFVDAMHELVKLRQLGGTETASGNPSTGLRPTELDLGGSDGARPSVSGDSTNLVSLVKDRKVLMAMANCEHVLNVSLEKVAAALADAGVEDTQTIVKRVGDNVHSMWEQLQMAYVNSKCSPLSKLIEQADYVTCSEVEAISVSCCNVLLHLVSVRAELHLNASQRCVGAIMSAVAAGAAQLYADSLQSIKQAEDADQCAPGGPATQVVADASAFEEATCSYLNPSDRQELRAARMQLAESANSDVVGDCLDEFRQRMRVALVSLRNLDNSQASTV